ncbi:MAG: hypothetical protein CMI04_14625 [Oceanospirillaceae bacterium]|nr:hypothetical protein [Oceanospirillaceae bacterium]
MKTARDNHGLDSLTLAFYYGVVIFMKLSRLIRESRLFWPSQVVISDGGLGEQGRGYFPTLCGVWDKAEIGQSKINEWHNLMSYVIFCAFHKAAYEKLSSGNKDPVRFDELDRFYMEKRILDHFRSVYPSWPKYMRNNFVNDFKS